MSRTARIAAFILICPSALTAGAADTRAPLWALQPLARPAPPQTPDRGWRRNPIDGFVLAALNARNLEPSPEADRATLIRRLTFDLTGLPPTFPEVERFIADDSPDAYERLVDRLLASPRYGEKWARHWLDAVRFAESNGFEMNQPRPNAWPYRDYVIASFNDDKPYDQFIREQLAGDALGVDEATGFLVAGPWDQVKSPDPNLTAQQRMDELHDMVATTGATFLGLTVGCARCHDHKFDPITQEDYYRLQAIFAGVQHGERPLRTGEYERHRRKLAARRQTLDAKLATFEPIASLEPVGSPAQLRPPVNPARNVDRFAPIEARFIRLIIHATNGAEPCIDELQVFGADDPTRNVALASAGAKASASSLLPGFAIHQVEHLNDGQYGNDHSWISNEPGKGWVQIELPRARVIDRVIWGRDRENKFTDRLTSSYSIDVAAEPGAWRTVATSSDRAAYRPGAAPEPAYRSNGPEERERLDTLLAEERELASQEKELNERQMVYAGTFIEPPVTHRLNRGEAMQPREVVAPGAIAAITPTLELAANTPEQQRRIALSNWIADPHNPLTARVIANRLWQHHFGRGIVETPSDFGHMGTAPSHPELLDWLAAQLIDNGWRLKPIQRMIVLSATYRQSARFSAEAAKLDAGDKFLWRYPPRRLEAEQLRDAILAISGKLDLTMARPGFDVFKPNDNYVRIYAPKDDFGPAEWRRMIYQFKPRLQQDGVFGAFDCPDGGQMAPRRGSSTTPLQALNLLNGAFVLQQADFFADRVKKEAGGDAADQAENAFRLALGRSPTASERKAAADLIQRRGLALLCRSLLNANEFIYVF